MDARIRGRKRCNFNELEQILKLALSPNKDMILNQNGPPSSIIQPAQNIENVHVYGAPLVTSPKVLPKENVSFAQSLSRGNQEKLATVTINKENTSASIPQPIAKKNSVSARTYLAQPLKKSVHRPLTSKDIVDENFEEFQEEPENNSNFISVSHQKNNNQTENSLLLKPSQNSAQKQMPFPFNNKAAASFLNPEVLKIISDFANQNANTNPLFSAPAEKEYINSNQKEESNKKSFTPNMIQSITIPHNDQQDVIKLQTLSETYQNGGVYEGEKLAQKKHGKGKYTYPDNAIYEGEWKNDLMEGFGTLYYPNKCLAYYGNWKEGKFHGKGAFYNKLPGALKEFDGKDFNTIGDGWNKYEGDFIMNTRKGKGELSLMNGGSYIGDFEGDLPHGEGVYRLGNGYEIKGQWMFGAFEEEIKNIDGLEKEVEICWNLLSQKNI